MFLEPEVGVETLGNKYEESLQDVATGEFYTQQTREEMIEKEPTRAVIVYKMPESAVADWTKTYYDPPIDFGDDVPGSQSNMGASEIQPHID